MADDIQVGDDAKPAEEGGETGAGLSGLLELLVQHGITLPEGTGDANLVERLTTALTALQGRLTPVGGEGGDADDKVSEESPEPMLMALRENFPVAAKMMEGLLAAKLTETREACAKLVESLTKRGVPADKLQKHFGASIGAIRMSLGDDGQPSAPKVLRDLQRLDDLLPANGNRFGQFLAHKTRGKMVEVQTPFDGNGDGDEADEEMVARLSGRPMANGKKT